MVADKNNTQRGQALVEFIIFLPLMLTMYTMIVILGDAIHGSINQQKATRSYFYYRMQNTPYITRPFRPGGNKVYESWNSFGHFFLGWADYLEGGSRGEPIYPCYKLNLPFATSQGDNCENSYSQQTTQFIRVGTVYGACGATMSRSTGTGTAEYAEQPLSGSTDEVVLGAMNENSCLIR